MSPVLETVCRHCGGPLPAGHADGFCCNGCAGAHALIAGMGLEDWYRKRDEAGVAVGNRPDDAAMTVDASRFVTVDGDGIASLHLLIDGITCAACVWLIEQVLARQPGIVAGRINMTTRRLTIRWRADENDAPSLVKLVSDLGYRLMPYDPCLVGNAAERDGKELLRCMAVAGFAATNIMLLSVAVWAGHFATMGEGTRGVFHFISALIAVPAVAYAGRPFFRSALAALRARRTNMDVPISLGVIIATGMSLYETMINGPHAYFDAATSLLFFLLIGRYLDRVARARAQGAAEHLLGLQAVAVRRIRADGSREAVPAGVIAVGDKVAVAAGERIGVDGVLVAGRSDVDAALVTGESLPQAVAPGASVFAGTLNLSAPIEIAVTAAGEGTLLAEIARMMEAAEQGKAAYVRLADRVARAYAPAVHILGFSTFIGWMIAGVAWDQALMTAVSVLIITCPCALALAVPVVQVVASGRLLRAGVLVKSADALERLARIDAVVFDKTGTLTTGRPRLRAGDGHDADDLALAASLAVESHHVLARALAREAGPAVSALPGIVEHPGEGLTATTAAGEIRLGSARFVGAPTADGQSPEVWLRRPDGRLARFAFEDFARDDAAETIEALRGRGLAISLISGDRRPAVERMARRLGIDDWRAEVDPAGKVAAVTAAAQSGRRVLMVGDGLNDAPALAAASVSMSPATGADISQTAADLVFQGDRLWAVALAQAVAVRSGRLAWQNIAVALGYNLLAVPLAMAGYVTPLIAAASMSTSSIIVVLNALRLKGGRDDRPGLSHSGRPGSRGAGPAGVPVGAQERPV